MTDADAGWAPRVHVIEGVAEGPTVAALGGVHGDEYEGVLAAAALTRTVRPGDGTFLVAQVDAGAPTA